jgi:hypothetical protein
MTTSLEHAAVNHYGPKTYTHGRCAQVPVYQDIRDFAREVEV